MIRNLSRLALAGGFCLTLLACGVDVQDGAGPLVPVPNLEGRALRAGLPADDLDVELRRQSDAVVVDETGTDAEGRFDFVDVEAGDWEVKIGGEESGDFDSVSREFSLVDPGEALVLDDFDVSRHGAEVLLPEDGADLPVPNLFAPLQFRWTLPSEGEVEWAQVKFYDRDGEAVWTSSREAVEGADWNGIGNEGDYNGQPVAAGSYSWRVKIRFADQLEARMDPRELVLE